MSSSKEAKVIKGQLRQIVKEILPELIAKELESELYKGLTRRIKDLEDHVKKTVHDMNERHKDTMGYIVRQASKEPLKKD